MSSLNNNLDILEKCQNSLKLTLILDSNDLVKAVSPKLAGLIDNNKKDYPIDEVFEIINEPINEAKNFYNKLFDNNLLVKLISADTDKRLFVVSGDIYSDTEKDETIQLNFIENNTLETLDSHHIESEKLTLIGETTAQIFHDVMNPLTVIMLSAQKMNRKLPEDIESKPLDTIISSVKRVQSMFQEVRDVLHQGEIDYEQTEQKANLKHIINKTLELVAIKVENSNIDFKYPENIENIDILGSELQFTQVLINLINNSIDAIIEDEERWISINTKVIKDYVHVVITDSGEGIPQENYKKIFSNLFSTKKKTGGTGLGLGICRKILRRYKGDVNINTKSENTSFFVSFKILKDDE